ncbi:MAG: hypothetical protein K2Q14_07900 [Gammaproteobacteria bacterium]|nr:hypothetical protein [Gammaproteobacteria bacterium]
MNLIILRLMDATDNIECTLIEEGNASVITKISSIDEALHLAQMRAAFLIISGTEVISLEKSLPKMPMNKLTKALPFAIEDQLLEPIDHYHIVITHVQENGRVSLLAIPQKKMQEYLQFFQHKLVFKAMLPDYFLLPYEAKKWHVVVEKTILIRVNAYHGLSCDAENWQQLLILLWEESEEAERPSLLVIHYCGEKSPLDKMGLSTLPLTIEEKNESADFLMNGAINLTQNTNVPNLLQDKFEQEHHLSPIKKLGFLTSIIVTIGIVVSLVSTAAQFFVLKKQDKFLQAQIELLYKQIYPSATSVVAPQIRMDRTLKELQNNQTGNGYLGLLASVGQVLKQMPAVKIITIHYQDAQLVLELQANNFNSLDLALDQLHRAGLIAKQDQGATKNNQVVARFTIQEKT